VPIGMGNIRLAFCMGFLSEKIAFTLLCFKKCFNLFVDIGYSLALAKL
jgi:hypothetical protein